jgi:protein TonB
MATSVTLNRHPKTPLPPARRQVVLGAIVALHTALGWGLLQGQTLQLPPLAPPPLLVSLLSTPEPPSPYMRALTPLPSPASPTAPALPPTPVPEVRVQAEAAATPPRGQEPAALPDAARRPAAVLVATATPATAATSVAVLAPMPVLIPASAVQYRVLPDIRYPAASRRLDESGLVIVAVLVDAAGLPQDVRLEQSSGFERLDRAALAGVRLARFKPFVLDGRPTAGWVRIPIPFELER